MRDRSKNYILAAALAVAAGAAVAYGNPAHPIERHVDHAVADAGRLAGAIGVGTAHHIHRSDVRRA